MKLFDSSVFQFCAIILIVAGLAAGLSSDVTWKDWIDIAMVLIGIYASKESVRYGATAYKDRPSA